MSDLLAVGVKRIAWLVLVICLVALSLWGIFFWQHRHTPKAPPSLAKTGPPVIQLEQIGELAPVRVHVADVLIAEGEGYRGAWLIKGDALLTCDLSRAKVSDVDINNRTFTLNLPALKVSSARVDFEKTKTWSVEKTTWLPWSAGDQSQFRDAAMFHAQQLVEEAAASGDNLETAKRNAELLLRQMYGSVDWTLEVAWGTKP